MAGWSDAQLDEVTDMLWPGAYVVADPTPGGLGFSEATPAEVPSWWADGPSLDDEREVG